ncbi:MAG: iron-containing alcohol dehydrogenase [Pirellulales bacterium]
MESEGQTNVSSQRFGAGSAAGLGRELGRFVVATMEIPWQVTKDRLDAKPEAVLLVESMEIDVIERQIAAAPECDCVVGIGGGQAIDLAKYFAWKRGIRLISIPTVLSVDAFVTPAAGVRRNHEVEYLGETSPDPLVIDYDLVRTAPPELNIAGVGDLLSCHTATFDWTLAERAAKSEHPFSQADVDNARKILSRVMDLSSEIEICSDAGLQAIVDGYMAINTICLPAGHYRVEEGSEHYIFYELEERLRRPFVHGYIVGLGIYLMSRLQENDAERVTEFMNQIGLKYHPADMQISRDDLVKSLSNVKAFVDQRTHLWYTVIDERTITSQWIDDALRGLRFED